MKTDEHKIAQNEKKSCGEASMPKSSKVPAGDQKLKSPAGAQDLGEYMKQYNAYMAACYTNTAWQAAASNYYNACNYYMAAASGATMASTTAPGADAAPLVYTQAVPRTMPPAYSAPSAVPATFATAADTYFASGVAPTKPGETSCAVCNVQYTDTKLLQDHLVSKRHLKNLEKQKDKPVQSSEIVCDVCNLTCYNQALYNVHIQSESHVMKQQEAYFRAQTAAYCASALPYYNPPAGAGGGAAAAASNGSSAKSTASSKKDEGPQKKKVKV